MGNEIHAIRRKDGIFLYRHYSTTSDMYTTPELTSGEMSLFLLYDVASDNLSNLKINPLREIYERLQRACENGTSVLGEKRSLRTWDRRKQDYWGDRFVKERTKEAFLADISKYLNTPFREHISLALHFHERLLGKKTKEASDARAKIKNLLSLLSNQ